MTTFKPSDIFKERYRIIQSPLIGGMCEVYRCYDIKNKQNVALRILKKDANHQRFIHAGKILQNLSHPNILKIYENSSFDGLNYQIEEYLEGQTLRELMDTNKNLTLAKISDIICSVLNGLNYLHQQGIIHQDLKPDNIFILHTGDIKIIDFGLAHDAHLEDIPWQTSLGISGTLEYIAPERMENISSNMSDIYSIGIIIYEMLTRHNPFAVKVKDKQSIIKRQKEYKPPPPSIINPQVSKEVDNIVMMAIAKDPRQRPQSADEFKTILNKVAQQPVKTRKVSVELMALILLIIIFGWVLFRIMTID